MIIFIASFEVSDRCTGSKLSRAILIRCRARYNVPLISPFPLEMGLKGNDQLVDDLYRAWEAR